MNIDQALERVNNLIKKIRKPANTLPKYLMYCISMQRTGLSGMDLASNIIKNHALLGIPTGPNTDGSPNLLNAEAYNIAKETARWIKHTGVVSTVVPPGAIHIRSVGANSGGTMISEGTNLDYIEIKGGVY